MLTSVSPLSQGSPSIPAIDGWALVVHPTAEVARARTQRLVAWGGASRVGSTGRLGDALARAALPEVGIVHVHLDGLDRFRGSWGGHRLAERLAGTVRVVAWVDRHDVDGAALARRCGAEVIAVPDEYLPMGVSASPAEPLEEWFRRRYDGRWADWVEYAAAVVVAGGEKGEQADAFSRQPMALSQEAATRRLRQLSELLCHEMRANEALLRRESLCVLRQIGWRRPLRCVPVLHRSLRAAAAALAHEPALAAAGGLGANDVRLLLEVAAEERRLMYTLPVRRGRPQAGTWRLRRAQALARVVVARGLAGPSVVRRESLERQLDLVLDRLHDAREDEVRTPFSWLDGDL